MEYVRFGSTGLKISRLCLGCMSFGEPTDRWPWALDEERSRPLIKAALENGINFFDTANIYSFGKSEEVLGRAIRDFARRDNLIIATKVHAAMSSAPNDGGLSRKHIFHSIDASLNRLQMDYVDLFQIHRWDYETPIEETMEALHDVVKSGKSRYIGASSMYAWQFAKAVFTSDIHGWTRLVSMQPHYNLIYREEERETLPFCVDQKLAVLPWSPLARGILSGKRVKGGGETERARTDNFSKRIYTSEADYAVSARVDEVARQRGVSNAQVALAWLFSKPFVTAPIIGVTKPGQLEDAIGALSLTLSSDEVTRLEEVYQPHAVLGYS